VTACIRALVPDAAVHCCRFGAVPLPYILDVRLATASTEDTISSSSDAGQGSDGNKSSGSGGGGGGFVSHESTDVPLVIAAGAGGSLRRPKTQVASSSSSSASSSSSSSSAKAHLAADELTSFTWTSTRPLHFAAFHRFVAALPPGVVRVKGMRQCGTGERERARILVGLHSAWVWEGSCLDAAG
jgi:G3E family GTPase